MTDPIRLPIILLLLSFPVIAQDFPEAPQSYWTKTNFSLIAADAAAKSVDMAYTMRNYGRPGFEEHDPLARPFVHSGPLLAGVAQGALFATEVSTSYELHRHGHWKMEKFVMMLGISGNTAGIATSTR